MAKDIVGKLAVGAFLIGTIIAIIFGLIQGVNIQNGDTPIFSTDNGTWIGWLLVLLGIIVGALAFLGRGTITKDEVPNFLTAGIALLIMYAVFNSITTTIGLKPWLGPLLAGISLPLAIFIAPAVGLLSIKAVWDIGKEV